jgi:hypothetical protein
VKSELDADWFLPIGDPEAEVRPGFHLAGELGLADAYGDSDDVPYTERFFSGGSKKLRGFAYRGVGPNIGGRPIGGSTMLGGTVEYRIPLYSVLQPGSYRRQEIFRMTLFTDAGILDPDPWSLDFSELRASVGFGFGLTHPIPLIFNFGFPIETGKGDSPADVLVQHRQRELLTLRLDKARCLGYTMAGRPHGRTTRRAQRLGSPAMTTKTLAELADLCGAELHGDPTRVVERPASLAEAGAGDVSFFAHPRYRSEFLATRAAAVLVPRGFESPRADLPLLFCADPSAAFTRVVGAFASPEPTPAAPASTRARWCTPRPRSRPAPRSAPSARWGRGRGSRTARSSTPRSRWPGTSSSARTPCSTPAWSRTPRCGSGAGASCTPAR